MSLLKAVIDLHCVASFGNLFQLESVLGKKKNTDMQEFDTVARLVAIL